MGKSEGFLRCGDEFTRGMLAMGANQSEGFKYLGTTLTNQNSIAEEIKRSLKSGSACYHSV